MMMIRCNAMSMPVYEDDAPSGGSSSCCGASNGAMPMAHCNATMAWTDTEAEPEEQLKVLGRLLGVEAFTLDDVADLPTLLARLPERRLVLIDTAGMSPRDPELAARGLQFAAMAERAGIDVCLTLSAAAQAGVIEEAADRFAVFRPTSCLLTKLDEATSLGGTLSMLVRTGLPVSYVSEGQRIPEDLVPARAHHVVTRAVHIARHAGATAGEELLTRRFGGIARVIA